MDKMKAAIEKELKHEINDFMAYGDGFSFTVDKELLAYKAAYVYRHDKVTVSETKTCHGWLVSVYRSI